MNNRFVLPQVGPTVKALLIANVVVYALQILPFIGSILLQWGALIPVETFVHGQIWRLGTYMFLHDPGSPFHLLFNMLALWMFGMEIESLWGSRRLAWFFMISGIGSGCFSILHLFSRTMSFTGVIGASGAVLALLTVYAMYYPHRQILLFFVVPVNIRVVVIGYAIISLFYSFAPQGAVAHLTHLGGILVAIGYIKWYPWISERLKVYRTLRDERLMRQRVETEAARKRFFEETVDPILEKIAREGMGSLSAKEKRLLKQAAASGTSEFMKKGRIIPLDLFR